MWPGGILARPASMRLPASPPVPLTRYRAASVPESLAWTLEIMADEKVQEIAPRLAALLVGLNLHEWQDVDDRSGTEVTLTQRAQQRAVSQVPETREKREKWFAISHSGLDLEEGQILILRVSKPQSNLLPIDKLICPTGDQRIVLSGKFRPASAALKREEVFGIALAVADMEGTSRQVGERLAPLELKSPGALFEEGFLVLENGP